MAPRTLLKGVGATGLLADGPAQGAATGATSTGTCTLTPTPVQTAAYSATFGDVAQADATTAALTVVLPATTATVQTVAIEKVDVDASVNTVAVTATGADKISGATALRLSGETCIYTGVKGVRFALAGSDTVTSLDARYPPQPSAPQTSAQTAEGVAKYVFTVTPATPGNEPFQVIANSLAHNGIGASTRNHRVHMGCKAGRHGDSSAGVKAGKPAVYMGFEDNFDDNLAGDHATYGVDWYVSYGTPDGTTVGVDTPRPSYMRVLDSNTNLATDKSVYINFDIGQKPLGHFSVWGGLQNGKQLFGLDQDQFLVPEDTDIIGNLEVQPLTCNAAMGAVSPIDLGAFVTSKVGGVNHYNIAATRYDLSFTDGVHGGCAQLRLTRGATTAAAVTKIFHPPKTMATPARLVEFTRGYGPILNSWQVSDA